MKLTFANTPGKTAVLIYPVLKKNPVRNAALAAVVKKLAATKEFEANGGQHFSLYGTVKSLPERVMLLGLGNPKKLNVQDIMAAFGSTFKFVQKHKTKKISIALPPELNDYAQVIIEALVMSNYNPGTPYKTGKRLKELQAAQVTDMEFIGVGNSGAGKIVRAALKKGLIIAEEVNRLRDWVNAPPNFATAEYFDRRAKEISISTGAILTILRKKELEKLKMGALLGVNKGSPDEARLIILDYKPHGTEKEAPIVFVGKGILFDTGGYNLKPSGHMEDMQLDKAGAASVLNLIELAAKLGIKRHIIAIAPCTENLIGPNAQKPSEIVTSYSGKTIEITNTDAEGRLILADAVAYAVDKFKPRFLIDVATLTGTCVVALGERYAGLFGNDKELMDKLQAAGSEVDELLWQLPIHKDMRQQMKGQFADLRNSSGGKYAGASKGALFIEEFVGKAKWAHIDIAGPAFTADPKKYEAKGATGYGLRVLTRFLEKLG